jgi:hypothetical protein
MAEVRKAVAKTVKKAATKKKTSTKPGHEGHDHE